MLAFGALVGLAVVVLWPTPPVSTKAPATAVAARPEREAAEVLRAWDERRSAAWASGDIHALSRLYADSAPAGQADVAMLRRWVARGLRVQGLTMQVLRLRVKARTPDTWRLQVTDRVAAADVVGPGAEGSLIEPEMPPGAARTRELVLRETEGTWQMVSVTDP